MRDRLLACLAADMGIDPSLVGQPGVTVAGDQRRAVSGVSAGYLLGKHLAITCDPAAVPLLEEATVDMEPSLEAWDAVAGEVGGALLGRGRMQVLASQSPVVESLPVGYELRRLDRTVTDDVALVARLVEASSEDDLDEAEISLDSLDEIIDVVTDPHGEIAAYSSSVPFEAAPDFGDIAILTREDCRGRNLGSIAVASLCERLRAEGIEPLYRCDEENTASIALSAGLGFEIATQLCAYRFDL